MGAYIPDLPGVITVGDSRDEVEHLIEEAIEFHLDGLRDAGQPIPAPSSFAGLVEEKEREPGDSVYGEPVGELDT